MTRAYYNENDEFAADWLRNLIKAGLIADGEVDTRSIVDVRPRDLVAFEQCHFFAGIGGWSYALRQAGWPDDQPVWTGSCPCQPFSLAGAQRGFADERHLWPHWFTLIQDCSPPVILGEQVASATEWLRLVRGDLETLGYAVGAIPVQAASAGADHLRDRYWFVADADDAGSQGRGLLPERAGERAAGPDGMANASSGRRGGSAEGEDQQPRRAETVSAGDPGPCIGDVADSDGDGAHQGRRDVREVPEAPERPSGAENGAALSGGNSLGSDGDKSSDLEWILGADGKARRVKPGIRLLAHGVPNRVGLLRGFGNAIDHRPAKEFIKAYMTTRSVSSQHQNTGG